MDIFRAKKVSELADSLVEYATTYEQIRTKAGKAKSELDIMLVAHLTSIRSRKSNVGYDMALLMLMEMSKEAQAIYQEMTELTNQYKGVEKIIDAIKSKISLEQSIMKYAIDGERNG